MHVLALETSGMAGHVAALDDDRLLAERRLDPRQRSATSLFPAIEELCRQVDWKTRDVELIAVAKGPGSFTGLRVGVTAAKVLAYAVGTELAGVSTLEAIAAQADRSADDVAVVMDAQRGQLFHARYSRGQEGRFRAVGEVEILDVADWLDRLQPGQSVTGPGLARLGPQALQRLPAGVAVIDAARWTPLAEAVGLLGLHQYRQGQRDDPMTFLPRYYRMSAAEEKRLAR